MADYTVPTTWKYYGSNGPDSSTFIVEGHTPAAPRLRIFDRKSPKLQRDGQTSSAQYRFRSIQGTVDASGTPDGKAIVETTIRWNGGGATPTIVKALLAEHATELSDVELHSDAVDELLLPR
jgi:hypothetical protein